MLDEEVFIQNVHDLKAEFGRAFIVVNEMLNASTDGLVSESYQNGPTDSLRRAMSFCVSKPNRNLTLNSGRTTVKTLLETSAERDMITIDANLGFATQPLKNCAGRRPVPEAFMSANPVGLSQGFIEYGRAVIGPVDPLFSMLDC